MWVAMVIGNDSKNFIVVSGVPNATNPVASVRKGATEESTKCTKGKEVFLPPVQLKYYWGSLVGFEARLWLKVSLLVFCV